MNDFLMYFGLGLRHITDLAGFDHIFFIISLCSIYHPSSYKKLLILITSFTLGHSISLALSILKIISIESALIEFLIPVTIVLTSITNLFHVHPKINFKSETFGWYKYPLTLFFGLIHGMGFSNYLGSLLGQNSNPTLPLFYFNIGLEIGQIVIIILYLFLATIILDIIKIKKSTWSRILSSFVAGVAFMMIIEKWPF